MRIWRSGKTISIDGMIDNINSDLPRVKKTKEAFIEIPPIEYLRYVENNPNTLGYEFKPSRGLTPLCLRYGPTPHFPPLSVRASKLCSFYSYGSYSVPFSSRFLTISSTISSVNSSSKPLPGLNLDNRYTVS